MKHILKLCCVVFVLTALSGCTKRSTVVSSLIDVTEKGHDYGPITIEELLGAITHEGWHHHEISLSFSRITDVHYMEGYNFYIPHADYLLRSKAERQQEVKNLTYTIDSLLQTITSDTTGKTRSCIYPRVVREVNRLAAVQADTKALLLYSDLFEYTDHISLYQATWIQLLNEQPQEFLNKLRETTTEQLKTDLTGIDIYIIYQPSDLAESTKFNALSRLYKQLFEARGAVVHIVAHLNTFHYGHK